jgi:hypothetical protein
VIGDALFSSSKLFAVVVCNSCCPLSCRNQSNGGVLDNNNNIINDNNMAAAAGRTKDALQATLEELQIRAAVEETVRSMLVDVELAVSLEKELLAEEELRHLQRRAVASELALREARVVKQEEEASRKTLADDLVKELWSLSQEFG